MPPKPSRTRVVRYDDFSGGEFGNVGASAAPEKSFTGKNVMRYRNGLLGPRPGVKSLSVTGASAGVVWGMRGVGSWIVYGQGSTVYKFAYPSPGAVASVGTLSGGAPAAGVQPCQIIQFGTDGYLSVKDDKAYKIDPGAGTITAYSSGVGGYSLTTFSERLMVGNRTSYTARVDSSSTGLDFATWPAAANFDFGSPDWSLVYMDELRGRLVMATTGQEWWQMTGDIELGPTVKRSARADSAPGAWYNVARLGERLVFVPYGEDFPVEFLGTVTDKLRYESLSFTNRSGNPIAAAALGSAEALVFLESAAVTSSSTVQLGGTPRMLSLWNGTWTYHKLGVATSKLVTPVSVGGLSIASNPFIFTDGGSAGAAPVFYVWDPTLDRPGKTGDTTAQPGDDSTTPLDAEVTFPEWWTPDGSEAIVRSISVDFAKWPTGSSSTNHFEVEATALHRYNTSGTRTSAVRSFDEASSVTTSDETLARQVFRVGDQGTGHGFKLRFSAMRGVALRRVLVEVELDPPRR